MVRVQLERLLKSGHFRNSKRYPTLLRHIVEEALEGRGSLLKERTLGVEVFGRAPDYDTASDPIVRVTVAEIRKRIAQYYHEDAHASELRIELTPGSYVPEFIAGREAVAPEEASPLVGEVVTAEAVPVKAGPAVGLFPAEAEPVVPRRRRLGGWSVAALAVLLLVVAVGGLWAWRVTRPTALERLWAPVFAKSGAVTYVVPMSVPKTDLGRADSTADAVAHVMNYSPKGSGTFLAHEQLGENVVFSDMLATVHLEPIVEAQHRTVRVQTNYGARLDELREGPVIMIGGLDNQWVLQALDKLRYRFGGSDETSFYIRDAKQPENRQWAVPLGARYEAIDKDYAIVARVYSESIGQTVMIVAGVGMSGTAAAGEFLADPAKAAEIERRLGPKVHDHDFELVLRSDVVDGNAGPAQIVAAELM